MSLGLALSALSSWRTGDGVGLGHPVSRPWWGGRPCGGWDLLSLHELGVGHTLQAVGEELEGTALREKHEQAVQGLDQVGVVLHVQ